MPTSSKKIGIVSLYKKYEPIAVPTSSKKHLLHILGGSKLKHFFTKRGFLKGFIYIFFRKGIKSKIL